MNNSSVEPVILLNNSENGTRLVLALKIYVGICLIYSFFNLMELQFLQDSLDHETLDILRMKKHMLWQTGLSVVLILASVACVILFLRWFSWAYINLHRLQPGQLKFKPYMASLGFFIPIACLVIPFKIMREIWATTQSEIKRINPSFKTEKTEKAIWAWWAFFIASRLISFIAISNASLNPQSIMEHIQENQLGLLSNLCLILAAFTLIGIQRRIAEKENALYHIAMSPLPTQP